jgi:hypothetical protein
MLGVTIYRPNCHSPSLSGADLDGFEPPLSVLEALVLPIELKILVAGCGVKPHSRDNEPRELSLLYPATLVYTHFNLLPTFAPFLIFTKPKREKALLHVAHIHASAFHFTFITNFFFCFWIYGFTHGLVSLSQ